MKLSEWAKRQGITYRTAWRWFRKGILPVRAYQTETGTIIVEDARDEDREAVALYARVSSHDQKTDLDRQLARLTLYASQSGLKVVKAVAELGSGLNGKRPKLMALLADKTIQAIVVEHRDRLMRFGSEYVEASLSACGRRLIVIDSTELKDDLVQDMIDVLTSFCARLYGERAAKNRALKAMEVLREGA